MTPRLERIAALSIAILIAAILIPILSGAESFPGGFIEKAGSKNVRPRLTAAQIRSFVPDRRGSFRFPAPYNTEAIRLTTPADCSGQDCVKYIGYSYWMNINNHVGSDTMLIFLGLDRRQGGSGPTLFSYNKVTGESKKLGPLFDGASALSWHHGAGWYFSATQPTKLYIDDDGPRLLSYDVFAKTFQTVFDVRDRFGGDKGVSQTHSSGDDRTHSGTLVCKKAGCTDGVHTAAKAGEAMGCLVYRQDSKTFSYFPRAGVYDECNLDKSGRWLVISDGPTSDIGNRIIDLQTGKETDLADQAAGRLGHLDMGDGYVVGANGGHREPNATLLMKLPPSIGGQLESVVHYNKDWNTGLANHVSHQNRRSDLPPEQQYACGSGLDRGPSENEIVCFRLDASHDRLVVAPVMTNPDAPGPCDDYCKAPKGNLDVTGRYFIWTSNLGGSRMDAFIVKVPAQLLFPRQSAKSPQ